MDYAKFNNALNIEELKAGIEEAKSNSKEFAEIPVNRDYEVIIEAMELGESKKGDPMVKIKFKIIDGEFKNQRIWMNQVVNKGMSIHILNEFLRSLDSGVDVGFEDYQQYGTMIENIFEAIDGKFEYLLRYGQNASGYKTFSIKEVYEVE